MSKHKNNFSKEQYLIFARESHQKNDFQKTIDYLQKVIEIDPNHADSYSNLGVAFVAIAEYQKAIDCYEKAIEINPNHRQAYHNLGVSLEATSEYQKAINCFKKTIEIDSNNKDAFNCLGSIFAKLQENNKAIAYYKKAIEIDPNCIIAHNNLGELFGENGEYQKSIACYENVIKIDPEYAIAYNNLGVQFTRIKDYKKAIVCYEKAIKINPTSFDTKKNIAAFHITLSNDFDKAIDASHQTLKLNQDQTKFINQGISLFRLKHDVEQAKYLGQTGGFWKFFKSKSDKIDGIDQFQKIGDEILSRKENKETENNSDKKILLTTDEINALLPFYKSDHLYKPKIISENCINPNKNWLEVEEEYFNSPKQIIYIDDFLSEETVSELREFCLISKVWNTEYNNKYLGAFSDSGFISQIHLQIAKDLQQKLPKLFGPHDLGRFWGFKYDTTLGKGINVHADFAIHNLNFWITPDEFNNNKNSGGLKVYDVPTPDHWTFKDYNANSKNIYTFLDTHNANCTNVPYKFNRAVLFNSAYFHETDEIDFKDEYEGRRINMTYLFGRRLVKSKN